MVAKEYFKELALNTLLNYVISVFYAIFEIY